jgi:hypothetical protein
MVLDAGGTGPGAPSEWQCSCPIGLTEQQNEYFLSWSYFCGPTCHRIVGYRLDRRVNLVRPIEVGNSVNKLHVELEFDFTQSAGGNLCDSVFRIKTSLYVCDVLLSVFHGF